MDTSERETGYARPRLQIEMSATPRMRARMVEARVEPGPRSSVRPRCRDRAASAMDVPATKAPQGSPAQRTEAGPGSPDPDTAAADEPGWGNGHPCPRLHPRVAER